MALTGYFLLCSSQCTKHLGLAGSFMALNDGTDTSITKQQKSQSICPIYPYIVELTALIGLLESNCTILTTICLQNMLINFAFNRPNFEWIDSTNLNSIAVDADVAAIVYIAVAAIVRARLSFQWNKFGAHQRKTMKTFST